MLSPETGEVSNPAGTNKQTVSRSHLAPQNKRAAGAVLGGGAEAGG